MLTTAVNAIHDLFYPAPSTGGYPAPRLDFLAKSPEYKPVLAMQVLEAPKDASSTWNIWSPTVTLFYPKGGNPAAPHICQSGQIEQPTQLYSEFHTTNFTQQFEKSLQAAQLPWDEKLAIADTYSNWHKTLHANPRIPEEYQHSHLIGANIHHPANIACMLKQLYPESTREQRIAIKRLNEQYAQFLEQQQFLREVEAPKIQHAASVQFFNNAAHKAGQRVVSIGNAFLMHFLDSYLSTMLLEYFKPMPKADMLKCTEQAKQKAVCFMQDTKALFGLRQRKNYSRFYTPQPVKDSTSNNKDELSWPWIIDCINIAKTYVLQWMILESATQTAIKTGIQYVTTYLLMAAGFDKSHIHNTGRLVSILLSGDILTAAAQLAVEHLVGDFDITFAASTGACLGEKFARDHIQTLSGSNMLSLKQKCA